MKDTVWSCAFFAKFENYFTYRVKSTMRKTILAAIMALVVM